MTASIDALNQYSMWTAAKVKIPQSSVCVFIWEQLKAQTEQFNNDNNKEKCTKMWHQTQNHKTYVN